MQGKRLFGILYGNLIGRSLLRKDVRVQPIGVKVKLIQRSTTQVYHFGFQKLYGDILRW